MVEPIPEESGALSYTMVQADGRWDPPSLADDSVPLSISYWVRLTTFYGDHACVLRDSQGTDSTQSIKVIDSASSDSSQSIRLIVTDSNQIDSQTDRQCKN